MDSVETQKSGETGAAWLHLLIWLTLTAPTLRIASSLAVNFSLPHENRPVIPYLGAPMSCPTAYASIKYSYVVVVGSKPLRRISQK